MTDVDLKTYTLCHDSLISTAFLVSSKDFHNNSEYQFIYFSDTGPNSTATSCDWNNNINSIWSDPKISIKSLRSIFVEVSYTNSRKDDELYGHMRPKEILKILGNLKTIKQVSTLNTLNVYIQHVKPTTLDNEDESVEIYRELTSDPEIDANFIFQEQGKLICLL
jgi:3',5'-cyclic-nucleotide phosphodiesterase